MEEGDATSFASGAMCTMDYGISTDEFERFRTLIYDESGISLSEQKRTLLASRLSKRLRDLELATVRGAVSFTRRF